MQTWLIGLFIRPLVLFIIFCCITRPVDRLMRRHMKDGRLKRFLLMRLN